MRAADATMMDLVGKYLGSNYRIVEPIGAGAMGMVFLVEHVVLPRRFAAKVLSPELARHPEAIARFEVEAHAISQLEHENVVSVVDYGKTDDGCVFLVMELLRGKTLQARIDQGSISLDEIVSVVSQVCRALAAAHAAGIVHRDMKPENVFLADRPGMRPLVKVLDFGVSKAREHSLRDGRITTQGQLLGSPEYMSPEASRGEEVDARADIYAVGIILYQLLCGDVPFRHENYLKVLQMHATLAPAPPRLLAPALPDAVERLILRALEKDPARRHPSIEDLELELLAAMPEVAERTTLFAADLRPSIPWARSSTNPFGMVAGTHPGLVHGRALSPAPPRPSDGTTIDTRRRRGRLAVGALWCAAVGVAAIAGIGLWFERSGGDRATSAPAAVGARVEPAHPPAPQPIVDPLEPTVPDEIRLHIDSSPPGAIVTLDGKRLGRTPIDAQLPPVDGDGQIQLELRGYRTVRRAIARDRDGELRVSLQREEVRRPQSRPEPRRSERSEGADRSPDGPDIKKRR